jgi:hypothetical protein
VYVADVKRIAGLDHYVIAEVWRHDPVLGPIPIVGSEWMPGMVRHSIGTPHEQVLITITANPRGQSSSTSPISDGRLPSGIPAADLRDLVRSGRPTGSPVTRAYPKPPGLEESIATATGIYLATVAVEDGYLVYHVSEVWRHREAGAAPKIGDELIPQQRHKAGNTLHSSSAVVFTYPEPVERAGLHSRTSSQVMLVINGYIADAMLFDVRKQVLAADAASAAPATSSAGAGTP